MFSPQACLFDLDGLLLDTEALHGKAWSQTAEKFGLKLTNDQLLVLRGRRRADCANQIDKWLKKTVGKDILLSTHQPISKAFLKQAKAMPGAQELVQSCFNKKIPMALVTSSSSDSLNSKASPHPWLQLITTRVLGDDILIKEGKPSPEPFLLAAKKLDVNPKKCWAMEDSSAGTQSALSAGCLVWVLGERDVSKNLEDDLKAGKNPIQISHLGEISKRIKASFNDIQNYQ